MRVDENRQLVKHLRKLEKAHGFKDLLYALSDLAGRKRSKKAQWGFLSYELKDLAHDEVPE